MRKILVSTFLVLAVTLGVAHAASAGGWAVVTLDPMDGPPTAGTPVEVGFTILQHGATPHTTTNAAITIISAAGARTDFTARPMGAAGHHVAMVTFPTDGVWRWEVKPDWFPVQALGEITVAKPAAAQTIAVSTSDVTPAAVTTTRVDKEPMSSAFRVLLGVALAAALLFTYVELRGARRRVAA